MDAHIGGVRACRLGMFVQAMVINLAPLLFVQLHAQFGLTWEMLGRLVLINFLTQLAVDLAGSRLIAACGLRPLCVAAHVAAFLGLLVFATAPFAGGYVMLVTGTVVFSAGSEPLTHVTRLVTALCIWSLRTQRPSAPLWLPW